MKGRSVRHPCPGRVRTNVDPLHDATVEEPRNVVHESGDEGGHRVTPASPSGEESLRAERFADTHEPIDGDEDHHPDADGLAGLQRWEDVRLHDVVVVPPREDVLERVAEEGDAEVGCVGDGESLEEEEELATFLVPLEDDHRDDVAEDADETEGADEVEFDERFERQVAEDAGWRRRRC